MTIEKGSTIGPYVIEATLGQGGMGVVYRANHTRLGRAVAIKVLKTIEHDAVAISRFEREARALALLRHPNILEVFDFGEVDGVPYMVSEYLGGGTLHHRLRITPRLEPEEAIRILRAIGSALDFAHEHGVIHRDVKPANVLLDERSRPVLADFGLARLASQASLTTTGMATGTPAYMSPEQVTNGEIGPASDRYSFSVLAYQLVTGSLPFPAADDFVKSLYAHIQDPPTKPSQVLPELPSGVDQVLLRGLAKNAKSRWESCAAMVDALEMALNGQWTVDAAAGTRAPVWLAARAAMPVDIPSRTSQPSLPPLAPPAVTTPAASAATKPSLSAVLVQPQPSAPATVEGPAAIAGDTRPRVWPWFAGAGGALVAAVILVLLLSAALKPHNSTGAPQMALSSTRVEAGDSLSVTGSNLPPGAYVRVVLGSQPHEVGAAVVDSNGDMQLLAVVPPTERPGRHEVRLCWNGHCPVVSALVVAPASTPTPVPPTPSATPQQDGSGGSQYSTGGSGPGSAGSGGSGSSSPSGGGRNSHATGRGHKP